MIGDALSSDLLRNLCEGLRARSQPIVDERPLSVIEMKRLVLSMPGTIAASREEFDALRLEAALDGDFISLSDWSFILRDKVVVLATALDEVAAQHAPGIGAELLMSACFRGGVR